MKRNVSDYLELMQRIYEDACIKCTVDVSDLRDMMTIRSRVESGGLSFLTIVLPKFCKDFEKSLANGFIDSKDFQYFRKSRAIPAFLQGMLSHIFDQETGELKDVRSLKINHPSDSDFTADVSTIIESVRQICLAFKKVEIPCSPEKEYAAYQSFKQNEREFEEFCLDEHEVAAFAALSHVLWGHLDINFDVSAIRCHHGPGATSERVSGNQKYRWKYWFDRLEPYFPLVGTGFPIGIPVDSEDLENVTIVPYEQEFPVRVVSVPKTLQSPRLIAIEPACMQYAQQGIRDYLYEAIANHPVTAGHVNFLDQSINRSLALKSSDDGRFATIDLSDASDRVPLSMVTVMLGWSGYLLESILACRSERAILPTGEVLPRLKKFASMGSALCFPIEAMYFYTICVKALLEERGLSCTPENVYKTSRDVYVYGDDIVVPTANAVSVLRHLQKYNCRVNTNKTFVTGRFRESCGIDAYGGYEVTPTYIRQEVPKNRRDAKAVVSWIAASNSFYKKGYWRTAQWIYNTLEAIIGDLPYVAETSSGLGRISYLGYESVERWNRTLQRFEVKAWTPKPVYRTDRLGGYGALMKFFTSAPEDGSFAPDEFIRHVNDDLSENMFDPSFEGDILSFAELFRNRNILTSALDVRMEHSYERTARHGAVALHRRWVPAH